MAFFVQELGYVKRGRQFHGGVVDGFHVGVCTSIVADTSSIDIT